MPTLKILHLNCMTHTICVIISKFSFQVHTIVEDLYCICFVSIGVCGLTKDLATGGSMSAATGQMWSGKPLSEFKRATFNNLCNLLRPWFTCQNTKYHQAVPVEKRVGLCIWRLATNVKYRSVSHLFGVGLSTCCHITQEVVTTINVVLKPKYIRHPTAAEMRVIV